MAGFIFVYMSFAYFSKPLALGKNKSNEQRRKIVDDLLIYAVLGVVIGGRMGFVFFYAPELLWPPSLATINTLDGGMSFHGGLLGVLIACWIFAYRQKISYLALMDVLAISTPVGLFFGRIANFINGELWGRLSEAPWAMIFKYSCAKDAVFCPPRHPSQLYEAALEGMLLFIIMYSAWRMPFFRKKVGWLSALFLLGYTIFRFTVEFFREPDPGLGNVFLGLTMGQTLSLCMITIAAWLISPYNKYNRKQS